MAVVDVAGFPTKWSWILGSLEISAAVGLIAGLLWWLIGIAAIIWFGGAIPGHLRKRDYHIQGAGMMLGVAAAVSSCGC